jgi:hypothetical protein
MVALNSTYKNGTTLRYNSAAELPPTGHPFTSFNPRTGRVTTQIYVFADGEIVPVDVVTEAQRRRPEKLKGQIDGVARRFLGTNPYKKAKNGGGGERYVFPRNLASKEDKRERDKKNNPLFPFLDNDQRVAIIHADLSGLGEMFRAVTRPAPTASIGNARQVVVAIEEAVEAAAQRATERVLLRDGVPQRWPRDDSEDVEQWIVPARPVVLGGDDITILVRADVAMPFAKALLEAIEIKTKEAFAMFPEGVRADLPAYLSACAGIAVVKAGQPFLMANALAESLCSFAKKHAKFGDPENPGTLRKGRPYPSLLAFHNALSTLHEDYGAIYAREMTPISETVDSTGKKTSVRLTANPYLIISDASNDETRALSIAAPADGHQGRGFVTVDQLIRLVDSLGAAAPGRGKLIEMATELFPGHNRRNAISIFARWAEVPQDLKSIQGSLTEIGFGADDFEVFHKVASGADLDWSSFSARLDRLMGPVTDALELIDFGTVSSREDTTPSSATGAAQ